MTKPILRLAENGEVASARAPDRFLDVLRQFARDPSGERDAGEGSGRGPSRDVVTTERDGEVAAGRNVEQIGIAQPDGAIFGVARE